MFGYDDTPFEPANNVSVPEYLITGENSYGEVHVDGPFTREELPKRLTQFCREWGIESEHATISEIIPFTTKLVLTLETD